MISHPMFDITSFYSYMYGCIRQRTAATYPEGFVSAVFCWCYYCVSHKIWQERTRCVRLTILNSRPLVNLNPYIALSPFWNHLKTLLFLFLFRQ
jgi:hypothetical protein